MDAAHVEWSRNLYDALREGGTWTIPNCGLSFRKEDGTFRLTHRMPHDKELPITAEMLRALQDEMIVQCKLHFGAAGIKVLE